MVNKPFPKGDRLIHVWLYTDHQYFFFFHYSWQPLQAKELIKLNFHKNAEGRSIEVGILALVVKVLNPNFYFEVKEKVLNEIIRGVCSRAHNNNEC